LLYLAIWGLNGKGKTFVMNHHPGGDVGNNNIIYPLHQNDRKVRCELCVGCFRSCIDTRVEGSGCYSETWALWTMPKINPQLCTLHGHIYILVRNGEDDFRDGKTDYFCIRMLYLFFMWQPVCMDTGQYDLCSQD